MRILSDGETLALVGVFDGRTTDELRDTMHLHLARTGGVAEFDLTRVESIDATALKVMVMVSRYAHQHGGHVTWTGCSAQVRRMLTLSHLRKLIDVKAA